jgi:hypothetical protein
MVPSPLAGEGAPKGRERGGRRFKLSKRFGDQGVSPFASRFQAIFFQ